MSEPHKSEVLLRESYITLTKIDDKDNRYFAESIFLAISSINQKLNELETNRDDGV